MFGACYLTEWTEGIEDLYEIGHEIEVYRNAAEFIEKAKELIADPAKRKTLKVNGQKRALNDHNITSSLNKIITSLNI
jgi:spore maturation protein CgeB